MNSESIKHYLFWILFLNLFHLYAQDKRIIDSLKNELNSTISDIHRVDVLNQFGWELSYNDLNEGLTYCRQAEDLARKINYKEGLAQSYNNQGTIYTDLGDYPKAIELHLKQAELAKQLKNDAYTGTAYGNLSRVFSIILDSVMDRKYQMLALEYYQKDYNKVRMEQISDPRIKNRDLHQAKSHLAVIYNNIAESFSGSNQPDSALAYAFKSTKFSEELQDKKYLGMNYLTIARIYSGILTKYDEAIENFNKALQFYKNVSDYDLASVHYFMAASFLKQKKYIDAEDNFLQAISLSRKVGVKAPIPNSYKKLSALYEEKGDLKKSLIYFKKYSEIKDSVVLESQKSQLGIVQSRIDNEKKNAEILILEQKNKVSESEAARHKTVIYSVISLLFIASLLVYILYVRNNEKIKTNKLLEQQKSEIQLQKEIVDVKNKEIIDSINYAQRIQQIILPKHEEIDKHFNNWFVFFQPKDIVSGDFYWFAQKDERTYIAAVDCTGHGVPGAFMSMIGYTLLNEILNDTKISSAADVLNELRNGIIKSLKQKGVEGENKDGMDISLCIFNGNTVQYAGAYNPLWHIRGSVLTEYKGDKQPIGIHGDQLNPFTNHSIDLKKSDCIYIFTDGYADQFGGSDGKKFKKSKLKELLLAVNSEMMDTQYKQITTRFNEWKGSTEQIDDVLLIGIRV